MLSEVHALVRLHELEFESSQFTDLPFERIETEKERCRSDIKPPVLARYEQQKWRHGSTALAENDDGVCSGCRVALPNALIGKLKSDVAQCDHCGRLVYDPESVYSFGY